MSQINAINIVLLHARLCMFLLICRAGARLISFSDVIEIKGAAAAATKEKETRDSELAQLQVRCFLTAFAFAAP